MSKAAEAVEIDEEDQLVSMRDTIENAYDTSEAEGPEDTTKPLEDEIENAIEKSARSEESEDTEKSTEGTEILKVAKDTADGVDTPKDDTQSTEKVGGAPAAWRSEAKTEWENLPVTVRNEVARREHNIQEVLQHTAEARQTASNFEQVWRPYEALIRADNSNPMDAAAHLFRSAATLRTGGPEEKARMVAGLVQQYGVDIGTLDKVLSGEMQQPGQPQQQQAPEYRDPRVDQLMGMLQQQQQNAANNSQENAQNEVEKFGSNKDFFPEVRDAMADWIEVAAKQGVTLSLEDAYTRAIGSNPEVSKALKQRQDRLNAKTETKATLRAKRAASSVASNPSGMGKPQAGSMSLRDSIEDAIELNSS